MGGKRFISVFLATIIFFLQGGDCVSLFSANKQAHDCCQKGHCNRKNPDPCCQTSSKTNVTQVLAKDKIQLPVLSALPVLPRWNYPVIAQPIESRARYRNTFTSPPPGKFGNFSLPLLV
jgi:hypothetical protein